MILQGVFKMVDSFDPLIFVGKEFQNMTTI